MLSDRDSTLLSRDDAPPRVARTDADAYAEAQVLALMHDVRNLLTPLVHCAAILRRCGSDPGRIERISEILERNVQGLNQRLEDLLDPPAARRACELHAERPPRRRRR
jgi:hypothetical protein